MTPETTQTPENNLRAELDRLTYAAFLLTLDHGKVLSAVLKAIDGSLEETTANSDLVERAVELALKEVRCESGTNWDGVYGTAMPVCTPSYMRSGFARLTSTVRTVGKHLATSVDLFAVGALQAFVAEEIRSWGQTNKSDEAVGI